MIHLPAGRHAAVGISEGVEAEGTIGPCGEPDRPLGAQDPVRLDPGPLQLGEPLHDPAGPVLVAAQRHVDKGLDQGDGPVFGEDLVHLRVVEDGVLAVEEVYSSGEERVPLLRLAPLQGVELSAGGF